MIHADQPRPAPGNPISRHGPPRSQGPGPWTRTFLIARRLEFAKSSSNNLALIPIPYLPRYDRDKGPGCSRWEGQTVGIREDTKANLRMMMFPRGDRDAKSSIGPARTARAICASPHMAEGGSAFHFLMSTGSHVNSKKAKYAID